MLRRRANHTYTKLSRSAAGTGMVVLGPHCSLLVPNLLEDTNMQLTTTLRGRRGKGRLGNRSCSGAAMKDVVGEEGECDLGVGGGGGWSVCLPESMSLRVLVQDSAQSAAGCDSLSDTGPSGPLLSVSQLL